MVSSSRRNNDNDNDNDRRRRMNNSNRSTLMTMTMTTASSSSSRSRSRSRSSRFVLILFGLLSLLSLQQVLAFNQNHHHHHRRQQQRHHHYYHYHHYHHHYQLNGRIKTSTTTIPVSHQSSRFILRSSSNNNNNSNNVDSQNQTPQTPQTKTPYIPIQTARPLGDDGTLKKTKKSLHPKTGDIVRYYDLDGGNNKGQLLVGKIAYVFGSKKTYNASGGGFSVELNELEYIGDGYYTEYSSALRNRNNRKTDRLLINVSPIAASFVSSEQAYKIPLTTTSTTTTTTSTNQGEPKVRQDMYDIDDYEGPAFYANINKSILEKDYENYSQLKIKLFRNVLLTGLFGTIISNASYGTEDSVIYFFGIVSSLLYLFLLSVKTDTVTINENDNTKNLIGKPIANLRFGTPVLLLIGISIYNIYFKMNMMSNGLDSIISSDNNNNPPLQIGLFDTVSAEQFGAAVLGFLTYRVPLFFGQIRDAFQQMAIEDAAANGISPASSSSSSTSSSNSDNNNNNNNNTGGGGSIGGITLPGSAGIVAKLFSRNKNDDSNNTASSSTTTSSGGISGSTSTSNTAMNVIDNDLITILLISGPQATGRSELVKQLLDDKDGEIQNLVEPNRILRRDDGATFERLQRRDEFLDVNEQQSSGFTSDGIINAAKGYYIDTNNNNNNNEAAEAAIEIPNKNVVVIDANVELAKRISQSTTLNNVRIIGVWVGLNSVKEFEYNIQKQINDGTLIVDESIGEESFMRGKIKDIITEIDFGLGSGIFEFTILNEIITDDTEDTENDNNRDNNNKSLMELKEAASYAFK